MANEEHLKILKQGVDKWNEWRESNREIKPDLSGANLSAANLSEADLHGTNLNGTNFWRANLIKANMAHANLQEAHLYGADLSSAILSDANIVEANLRSSSLRSAYLGGANIRGAILTEANLNGAILDGADLTDAIVGFSTFSDVDLITVKGLETVKHVGPSSIGIDTIYRSKGRVPVEFLRGTGVLDNFIEFMSSLVGTTLEFYSCFISYSGKDQEFADRLFADLQHEGVRCWFAPHHVQAGKKLHEQIDVAIRMHEKLLLILSPDSINSEWVKTEIAKARKREIAEDKRVLFPVSLNISFKELTEWECFDADRCKDSAREIREYYIPDFTKWKDHDQYQEEFKKLVRDLKK